MAFSRLRSPDGRRLRWTALVPLWLVGCPVPVALAVQGPGSEPVLIVVTDKGCDPDALTVAAGRTAFKIRNQSARVVEWEILNGVTVVEERENILPGFVQSLTAELEAGQYQMTCGLLSNPKGRLTVTAANAVTTAPSDLELVAPLAEYKVYVMNQVDDLVKQAQRFAEAVKAGRLEEAQALYAPTRQPYERIEPIAELFADLDKSLDARADDFELKEADPGFVGFHRLEKALFADKTTNGMQTVADRLVADVAELKTRVAALTIPPKKMVGGAADLIEEVASTKISGEEDRYSHTDLWDFQANVDGARTIVELLHPLLVKRNSELAARIDKNFAKADSLLGHYHAADRRFASYEDLKVSDRNALKGTVTALAEDLSLLRGTLGLE
jgi:iron uptake system component EfeO